MTPHQPPAETIKTADAAEAIIHLLHMFSMGGETPDDWVEELKEWPDLAAAVFTAVRTE